MPKLKNAPDKMNHMMESVYMQCMIEHNDKSKCSQMAIGTAKKHFKKQGGKWVKR